MFDLISFAKQVAFTFLFILLLQIKVGENTLEMHAMNWVHTSPIIEPLQDVSEGAIKALRSAWRAVGGQFNDKVLSKFDDKKAPGSRSPFKGQFSRSKDYLNKRAEELRDHAEIRAKVAAEQLHETLQSYEETEEDYE